MKNEDVYDWLLDNWKMYLYGKGYELVHNDLFDVVKSKGFNICDEEIDILIDTLFMKLGVIQPGNNFKKI